MDRLDNLAQWDAVLREDGFALDDGAYFQFLAAQSDAAHEKGDESAPGAWVSASTDVVADSTFTNVSLSPGGYYEGVIDAAGDHDWIRVTLIEGQTYVLSTMFSIEIGDTVLALRDSAGNVIADNDDANAAVGLYNSEITFTPTTGGIYYLDVSGYGTNTGAYYLSVSNPPFADAVRGTATTTASVTVGGNVSGTIDQSGDHDWYAVQLVAGQTYLLTTSTVGAGDVDTSLFLRGADGTLLAYNDDASGTYSRIRFTATSTGTYYVDVSGWAESDTGTFKLDVQEAAPLQVYTYDQIAYQLTNTYWGGTSRGFNVQAGGTLSVNVSSLNGDAQFLAREALNLWSDVTGITFNEVTVGGQILFEQPATGGASAESTFSGSYITSSTVSISAEWLTSSGTGLRSYSFQTYLHEIGHALGLGHAGPYNNAATYAADAAYLNDAWATTVMSYFDQEENTYFGGLGFTRVYAQSPMIADIVAVGVLYGTAGTTRTGNTTYGFNNSSGRAIYDAAVGQASISVTVVDHGGTDTLDYSGYSSNQRIDLNAESFSNIGGSIGNLSIARGTVIENARGGNGNDSLIGNAVANSLTGGLGVDAITGGSNVDTAVFSGNRAAYAITQTATGVFQLVGPDGTDTLTTTEYAQFADQTLRLLPGTGTAVDFNAAASTWMGSIRDFDGNDLGSASGWKLIGSADVDGDGDQDRIIVNREIGRFAEVATGPDGLVYFSDYSWAGETRVVGIYIDPLVTSGQVVQGGPFDSQRRFQNDLLIDNIAGVLGAGDYDRDGLQEVYFRLTDGTAYLHAYMHADGNIRYANYQSQSQVVDFLTANSWASSTWAGWFPSGAEALPKVAGFAADSFGFDEIELASIQTAYVDDGMARWAEDHFAMQPLV